MKLTEINKKYLINLIESGEQYLRTISIYYFQIFKKSMS